MVVLVLAKHNDDDLPWWSRGFVAADCCRCRFCLEIHCLVIFNLRLRLSFSKLALILFVETLVMTNKSHIPILVQSVCRTASNVFINKTMAE